MKRARLILELLEARWQPSVNVLSYHNDTADTGLNAAEVQLSPANVQVGAFGKLYSTAVDGQIYAQPLVLTSVQIAAGQFTQAGAVGLHDVTFVATENDSLYAIDASVNGGQILWQRSFLDPSIPANNTLGATTIVPVAASDVGTADISPVIGITGTPVIDANTGTLYLVTKTAETINNVTHYVQRLHAINVTDGTDRSRPT